MRSRQTKAKESPPGEWAVFHERPFPARLDRGFRIAAIAVGAPILATGAVAALYAVATSGSLKAAGGFLTLAVLAGPIAYGVIRAAGLIVTSLYGLTRRKRYVLDWSGPGDAKHQGGLTPPDVVALALVFGAILLAAGLS